MEATWRWFGPDDPVSLLRIRQAGAQGIVTALDHVPPGEVWPFSDVRERKRMIEAHGLRWSVVESLPVHPAIRLQEPGYERFVSNYQASLENLASSGVRTVCYNFMPVLDWTRTRLDHRNPDGSVSLGFDATEWAAFDLFILERPDAENDYTPAHRSRALQRFRAMDDAERAKLERAILGGLPGAQLGGYTLQTLRRELARWTQVTPEQLFENLVSFLERICPTLDEHNVNLCVHPDDPPWPLLGLPRILSKQEHFEQLFARVPNPHNGLVLCAGSLGASRNNAPHRIAAALAPRIHFAHLRSVSTSEDDSFTETDHLSGSVHMLELARTLLEEERRRKEQGREDWQIPMRPDHGATLDGDIESMPGYSWLGRLKGLSELRGLLAGLRAGLPREAR